MVILFFSVNAFDGQLLSRQGCEILPRLFSFFFPNIKTFSTSSPFSSPHRQAFLGIAVFSLFFPFFHGKKTPPFFSAIIDSTLFAENVSFLERHLPLRYDTFFLSRENSLYIFSSSKRGPPFRERPAARDFHQRGFLFPFGLNSCFHCPIHRKSFF